MTEMEAIAMYIMVRDRRAARKADYTAADAKDTAVQNTLEANFLAKFNKNGTDSVTCHGVGTAYISVKTTVSAADKELFFDFAIANKETGLLDIRPLKSAVEVYRDQHGALPPGLNWSEERVVNVRRSK